MGNLRAFRGYLMVMMKDLRGTLRGSMGDLRAFRVYLWWLGGT